MNPVAVLSIPALAAGALSLYSVFRAQALVRAVERQAAEGREQCHAAVEALLQSVEGLSRELRDLRSQTPPPVPAPRKTGLNWSKRSEVLRLHGRGDTPGQIAGLLEIPPQEVELLLKIHHIVIQNL